MDQESLIARILANKLRGIDCTEEESADIKMYIKETLVQVEGSELKIIEEIQEHFPIEYGEAIDEMNS